MRRPWLPCRLTLQPKTSTVQLSMSADTQLLESLAFLYLTFGHSTDGTLTADEMRSLATKLREWAPASELGDIGTILRATVADYKAAEHKISKAREITQTLRGSLDVAQVSKILADLEEIAAADGHVSDEEKAFIAETREALGS